MVSDLQTVHPPFLLYIDLLNVGEVHLHLLMHMATRSAWNLGRQYARLFVVGSYPNLLRDRRDAAALSRVRLAALCAQLADQDPVCQDPILSDTTSKL